MLTALVLALATAAPAATAPPVAVQAGAEELAMATRWLALLDAGRWDESWQGTGALFQSQMPQARWAAAIQPVRTPLGAALSRKPGHPKATHSLPGAPDGDYRVIEFQTHFANKAEAIETLVLAREGTGWKVDGYFIR